MSSSSAGEMSGHALPSGVAAAAAAAAAGADADTESVRVVRRRIRALNKKLNRIEQIESDLLGTPGKILEPGQAALLETKPTVQASLDELNRLIDPIKNAVAQDIASAIAKIDKKDKAKQERAEKAVIQEEKANKWKEEKEEKGKERKEEKEEEGKELKKEKAKLIEPLKKVPVPSIDTKKDEESQIRSIRRAVAVLVSSSSATKERKDILRCINKEVDLCSSILQSEKTLANVPGSSSGPSPKSWAGMAAGTKDKVKEKIQDDETCKRYQEFLRSYAARSEDVGYYIGEAMSLATRKSPIMCVKYAHLEEHNRDLAMKICDSHQRLKRSLEEISREFVLNTLKSRIPLDKFLEVEDDMKKLMLKFVRMPKSHQLIKDVLTKGIIVGKKAFGISNSVPTPSPRICIILRGVMGEMLKKQREGWSWNGTLGLHDIEVYNGHRVVITKIPSKVDLCHGTIPAETKIAFQNDFTFVANSIVSKLKIAGKPPHFDTFMRFLKQPDPVFMTNMAALSEYHDLLLHNWFIKPPMAQLNFQIGIHSSCSSHDEDDPEAYYKTVLASSDFTNHEGYNWMQLVEESGHSSMIEVLGYPNKKDTTSDVPKPPPYTNSFESCSAYQTFH
ncbi:hypothetical protein ACQ4PT_054113 [Festuca glaucescens]